MRAIDGTGETTGVGGGGTRGLCNQKEERQDLVWLNKNKVSGSYRKG